MSELKTLYRHASHYLGGRICLMLLGFVSFPILARVFSVADYGIMSLVLKLVLLMTVLGKFGLQNSVQRFYPEEGKSLNSAVRRKYYSSLITGSAVVGTLAMAAYAAGLWLAPERLLEPRLRYLLLFTSGLILIRSLQPTLIGFLRAEGRTKTYNSIEIGTRAATVLTACTLLIVWKRELTVFLGTTIAVEAAAVLALLWFLYKQGVFAVSSFNRQYFQKAALFAFPLIGYELASVILDSGDRLFVQRYMGAQALGYYS